jgi:hypothetical protein
MRTSILTFMACALLTLSGCGKQDANTEGNGPGNADGFGGRADPQTEQNDPAKRDAAPGSLSETSPPSTDEEGRQQQPPTQ